MYNIPLMLFLYFMHLGKTHLAALCLCLVLFLGLAGCTRFLLGDIHILLSLFFFIFHLFFLNEQLQVKFLLA